MTAALLWPLLTFAAAALQVARNAAQRELSGPLGLWGATSVRFIYGLPFALVWLGLILAWRGPSGGPSLEHLGWAGLGGVCQAAAMALLMLAMQGRAFAVANALTKTEVMGAALLGLLLLNDQLGPLQWAGMIVASFGVALIAGGGAGGAGAWPAAAYGIASGLFFSVSSVAYRGAGLAWGDDAWVGAAATLVTALAIQALGFLIGFALINRPALTAVARHWRPSLLPGGAGAMASACLFTAFALGPSAGAVKAVQLVDVLIAWAVSRRFFQERLDPRELLGGALAVLGILAVTLFQ